MIVQNAWYSRGNIDKSEWFSLTAYTISGSYWLKVTLLTRLLPVKENDLFSFVHVCIYTYVCVMERELRLTESVSFFRQDQDKIAFTFQINTFFFCSSLEFVIMFFFITCQWVVVHCRSSSRPLTFELKHHNRTCWRCDVWDLPAV